MTASAIAFLSFIVLALMWFAHIVFTDVMDPGSGHTPAWRALGLVLGIVCMMMAAAFFRALLTGGGR